MMEFWWGYLLLGIVCGIFSSVFGVGSGILLIPALVIIFSFPQKSAQGICLAVMVPMALVGAYRYKVNPDIEMNMVVVLLLAIGAMAGAVIGSQIAAWASGPVLRKLFACVMIIAAIKMLMVPNPKKAGSIPETEPAAAGGVHVEVPLASAAIDEDAINEGKEMD